MINAVFVGLDRAGKTSIKLYLQYLDSERASKTVASTGVERLSRAELTISIIPGQEVYRLNEDFYRILFPSADYIVFIVDASKPDRLKEAKEYFEFVKKMYTKYAVKKPKIILVAHKQDSKDAIPGEKVKEQVVGKRSDIVVLETSIYDPLSMLILLKSLYADLKGNYIDFISQALAERLGADTVALYDSQSLPISIAGKKDLLEITCDKYGRLLFNPEFRFGVLGINGTKLAAVAEDLDGHTLTIVAVNFRVDIQETLKVLEESARNYVREFVKRWGDRQQNPWNL